jgi:hypothetical protein
MSHARIALCLSFAFTVLTLLVFSSTPAVAHGGGIDIYGGHKNNKAGNYHAHQGSCAGKTFASQDAAIKAGCNR